MAYQRDYRQFIMLADAQALTDNAVQRGDVAILARYRHILQSDRAQGLDRAARGDLTQNKKSPQGRNPQG